jgi:hypothetical protein
MLDVPAGSGPARYVRVPAALPVLPSILHAVALYWAAYDLAGNSSAAFVDVVDGLRGVAMWFVYVAIILTVLAVFSHVPVIRRISGWALGAALFVQVLWTSLLVFVLVEDHTNQHDLGEVALPIALTGLGTAALMVAASVLGIVALRRQATRAPGPAAPGPAAPGHAAQQ